MQAHSLKRMALVVSIFFLTTNLSSMFLPVYFQESGLDIPEITGMLFFTFIVMGLLPFALLKTVKNFERIISFGIFSTMLFYIALIYVKDPVALGLAYGLGIATFWPSFNLLQFRLSESRVRAQVISLFSSIIPSIASIIGPAAGGFIIQDFGFTITFMVAITLYFLSFLFSLQMPVKPETFAFSIPKARKFLIFFITFILLGFTESYWLAYPLFVHRISGTLLYMGMVLALSAILISTLTFLVNWLSDIKKAREKFAVVGAVLNAVWYFALANVSATHEIIALSVLSGLASAFMLSWLAHYGDCFYREHYASILVMMEVGLMIGRMVNLAPTLIFITNLDYASYFRLLGIASFSLIPFFVASSRYN